jgi:hypothetical protein
MSSRSFQASTVGSGGLGHRFASLRVGMKLSVMVGALVVVASVVGVVGTTRVRDVQRSGDRIYSEALQPIMTLDHVKLVFYMRRLDVLTAGTTNSAEQRAKAEDQIEQKAVALHEAINAYEKVDRGEHRAEIDRLRALIAKYDDTVNNEYLPATRRDDHALAEQLRDAKMGPITDDIVEVCESLVSA